MVDFGTDKRIQKRNDESEDEIMKYIPRNKYYQMIRETGRIPDESEYDIADLDLSTYPLNEDTKRIANVNFMEETEDRNGNYMLSGHWMSDLSYQFAKKCKFDLVQVNGYSSYAYSDEQMAVFTYTEGDIYLTLFTDKAKYKAEKERTSILIMAYKRKTKDCYAIEGNCGYGWDIECNCEDRADAKAQLKTYRENVTYPVRIKKWRERISD